METAKIGLNAGLVWRKLNENGSFPIQELARKLDLGAEDTALAIGWLARENKVSSNPQLRAYMIQKRK